MTESMASEPAEPTTRQDPVEQAVELASEAVHAQWMETKRAQGVASRCSESGEELMVPYAELSEAAKDLDRGSVRATVTALAEAGLLADPAQTTELERLRAQVALLGRHLQSSADKDKRIIAWRVEAEQAHQNWEGARAANMTALETIAELRAERDERQTRIDKALEWWRQERDADHYWPLSLEDYAKVNSLRYRVYAALIGHPLADQPMRAALAGDQPTAEEPYRCPTLCDDDCESPCHEAHAIPRKRQHDVADCEARQPLSGEALRNAEERDDAAGDLP